MSWREECTAFERRVYRQVRRIPRGQVRSYGWVARAIGKPKAARAVGQALKRNRWPDQIPCHRVIASNGSLGGYAWGQAAKRQRLSREGVSLKDESRLPRHFPVALFVASPRIRKV